MLSDEVVRLETHVILLCHPHNHPESQTVITTLQKRKQWLEMLGSLLGSHNSLNHKQKIQTGSLVGWFADSDQSSSVADSPDTVTSSPQSTDTAGLMGQPPGGQAEPGGAALFLKHVLTLAWDSLLSSYWYLQNSNINFKVYTRLVVNILMC